MPYASSGTAYPTGAMYYAADISVTYSDTTVTSTAEETSTATADDDDDEEETSTATSTAEETSTATSDDYETSSASATAGSLSSGGADDDECEDSSSGSSSPPPYVSTPLTPPSRGSTPSPARPSPLLRRLRHGPAGARHTLWIGVDGTRGGLRLRLSLLLFSASSVLPTQHVARERRLTTDAEPPTPAVHC